MSDPFVNRWKLTGVVYFWRVPAETRNFPGWNCTADADGCRSLIELIGLMLDATWSSAKIIPLTWPTEAIVSLSGGERESWRSPRTLRLVYPKGAVDDGCFRWSEDTQAPTLTVGRGKLECLQKAFESVARHRGDFCIHADDQPRHGQDPERMAIWFW